ncbi:MAG: hypothetical protein IT378_09500 [Sandaracinaceae bacterium]|nr:hypothetical protein [Sandaracinaceae bacterium]MCC6874525.1 hypothetical protein [Sandaracinaceae bacterium]
MQYDGSRPGAPALSPLPRVQLALSEEAARALAEDLTRAYRDSLDTRRLSAVRLDPA